MRKRVESSRNIKTVTYVYMGLVERVCKPMQYRWYEGYSRNGVEYPWLTKTEARAEAAKEGATATFIQLTGATAP